MRGHAAQRFLKLRECRAIGSDSRGVRRNTPGENAADNNQEYGGPECASDGCFRSRSLRLRQLSRTRPETVHQCHLRNLCSRRTRSNAFTFSDLRRALRAVVADKCKRLQTARREGEYRRTLRSLSFTSFTQAHRECAFLAASQFAEKLRSQHAAPKGATDCEELVVSLKRVGEFKAGRPV